MFGTSIWDDTKREFRSGNVISQLIIVNVAVFLIINIVYVVVVLIHSDRLIPEATRTSILSWIALPGGWMPLLERPWTLITHMFVHFGIFHILFNMLCLYWFGRIIQEFIGNKKILPLYILGGVSGAFLLLLSYTLFPGLSPAPAFGASAGVLAIIVAAATLVPDYTIFLLFFGAVRLKYIAFFMIVIDLVSIPGLNSGGHIAHLGGALFGYIFIKQLQVGHDWSQPFNNFFEAIGNFFRARRQPRVVHKTRKEERKKRSSDVSEGKQQQIDAILDKIARSGYDSLTKEEKEFLFKVSKEGK